MKGIIAVKRIENNQLLIKYIYKHEFNDNIEYKNIASVYTTFNAELIKMFRECYENDIIVTFNECSEEVDKEYLNDDYYIEDIQFQMGTNTDLFVLEVTIK